VIEEGLRTVLAASNDPTKPMPPGTPGDPIRLSIELLPKLIPAAARLALGQTTTNAEVVWSDGGDELVVDVFKISVKLAPGFVQFAIPVRCDQTGAAVVQLALAVGGPDRPAGLFAAAERRPRGPAAVVDRWADALVALAWGTLLQLANVVSAAAGRDDSAQPLVPAELVADQSALTVIPFARHLLGPLQK
jgi:hypothetical protein